MWHTHAFPAPEPADLKLSLLLGWGAPDLPPEGTVRVYMTPMPVRGTGPVAAVVAAHERPEAIASAKDTKWCVHFQQGKGFYAWHTRALLCGFSHQAYGYVGYLAGVVVGILIVGYKPHIHE